MKDIVIKGENIQNLAQRLACMGCTEGSTYLECGKCNGVDDIIKILLEESSIESKKRDTCYCGKPIDTTNPDCVEFRLCKDHADDC